jgi:hypothetical protein
VPDLAAARYVNREMAHARATAELCRTVATNAGSQGRRLVAAVLQGAAAELVDEAAFLAAAARPDAPWPCRLDGPVIHTNLDDAIDAITDSLDDSERALRWIARRPDLPPVAAVAFDALAEAR